VVKDDDDTAARRRRGVPLWPLLMLVALGLFATSVYLLSRSRAEGARPGERPSPTLLIAIRDLARLETTELHAEKVIDLTDKQSQFFGLIDATDAILLVASGDVVVGVDLGKMGDGDLTVDPATHVATLRLPAPEVFSVRLDEKGTYVHSRATSLTARRDEQLESRARQAAIEAIERAARESDVLERSRRQAERELRALAAGLGTPEVRFEWRAP